MAVAREQDVKNLAVFALDALTSIPAVPTAGVAYRDAAATEETFEAGQAYSSVYNSATYNQLFYLLSSVAKSMCEYGIMPFIAGQAYKQYARCIWTDGNVYRCSRDIAADESPYPTPKDESNVWSREEVLLPVASKTQSGIVQIGTGLDIDAGILSVSSLIESFRKSWIGIPRPWRSTTLPENHVWANGGLVLFEDYPELEEVYDAGGFSGMLLAYNADEGTIAANLGKWRPNSANPTGLFVPSLGGQFSRTWVPGQNTDAGAWSTDTGRGLTGTQSFTAGAAGWIAAGTGVFEASSNTFDYMAFTGGTMTQANLISFNAASVWNEHAADEFAPQHIWQPYVIYLGITAR